MPPRIFYIVFSVILGLATSTSTPGATSVADFAPLKIATGGYHTCVLSTDGAIKCWGSNSYGQLGTGDTLARGDDSGTMGKYLPIVDLGLSNGEKVVDICGGRLFTCALTQEGRVKCWGDNSSGQLGQGLLKNTNLTTGKALAFTDLGKDFRVKTITCGGDHACALSEQGLIKCWGDNSTGSLGLGDKLNRGRRPEDMGDSLAPVADLININSISTGYNHSCALSSEGARCWGRGSEGQLGLESNNARGQTSETVPGKSPFINLITSANETILKLTTGSVSTCALMTISADRPFVKCWGHNTRGSLGTGNAIPYGLKEGTMGANLPRVDLALENIVALSAHLQFVCALTKEGRVKCWGKNDGGQLGLGNTRTIGAAPTEMGPGLPDVDLGLPAKAISSGSTSIHSCAILINSEIKCWGYNDFGQLGYENTANVGTMSSQMGEALPFVRYN